MFISILNRFCRFSFRAFDGKPGFIQKCLDITCLKELAATQYQGTFYFCIDMNIVKKIVNFNVKNLIRFFPRTSGKTKQKENFIRTFKIYRKDDILFRRGRYQISNVLGSSGDSGSKKKYWERHSKLKFSFCLVEKCRNRATVGGHVWIKEFPWKKSKAAIYIIPLCQVTVFHC